MKLWASYVEYLDRLKELKHSLLSFFTLPLLLLSYKHNYRVPSHHHENIARNFFSVPFVSAPGPTHDNTKRSFTFSTPAFLFAPPRPSARSRGSVLSQLNLLSPPPLLPNREDLLLGLLLLLVSDSALFDDGGATTLRRSRWM